MLYVLKLQDQLFHGCLQSEQCRRHPQAEKTMPPNVQRPNTCRQPSALSHVTLAIGHWPVTMVEEVLE